LEEKFDSVVVHLNGWLHTWNECVPNSKVKNRIRPRQAATKVGALGEENPDRVLDDWQRLRASRRAVTCEAATGTRRGEHGFKMPHLTTNGPFVSSSCALSIHTTDFRNTKTHVIVKLQSLTYNVTSVVLHDTHS
jgi:hypothetical protein